MTAAIDHDDLFRRVRTLVMDHLAIDADKVTPSAIFMEDLGCDSLDVFELVMAAEDEFRIEIDDDEIEEIVTVQQAVDCITKKLERAAS